MPKTTPWREIWRKSQQFKLDRNGELTRMTDDDTQDDDFFDNVGSQQELSVRKRLSNAFGLNDDDAPTELMTPDRVKKVGGDGKSWTSAGDTYWRVGETTHKLPAGIYRPGINSSIGPNFTRMKNDTDKLIVFPDSASFELIEEIRKFRGMREKFDAHGFLFKRGILMHGPPGSGKTVTLQLLIKMIIEDGGVAIYIDDAVIASHCLAMLRSVEPERQIIGIMEDIDSLVERGGESQYLALLDGESQVNNAIYVATTNYPERLDKRFVDRPSRFDTIKFIGMPSAPAREVYFRAKIAGVSDEDVQAYVQASEGYSVAHMREMIILTRCFDETIEAAKKRLDKSRHDKLSSTKKPGSAGLGFGGLGEERAA